MVSGGYDLERLLRYPLPKLYTIYDIYLLRKEREYFESISQMNKALSGGKSVKAEFKEYQKKTKYLENRLKHG